MYSHFWTQYSATLKQECYVSVQYCTIYSTAGYHSPIICRQKKRAKHEENARWRKREELRKG